MNAGHHSVILVCLSFIVCSVPFYTLHMGDPWDVKGYAVAFATVMGLPVPLADCPGLLGIPDSVIAVLLLSLTKRNDKLLTAISR
jgi:hypothetical protein